MPNSAKHPVITIISGIISWIIVLLLLKYAIGGQEKEETVSPPPTIKEVEIDQNEIETAESDFEKYNKLRNDGQVLSLLQTPLSSPEFSKDDQDLNNKIAKEFLLANSIKIKSTGKIQDGYLRIVASVEGGPLSQKESIYAYLHTGENGGHLYKPNSISVTPNGEKTELIFKLDKIDFTNIPYKDSNNFYSKNWLTNLQKGGTQFFGSFVSTTKEAKLETVEIIYLGEPNALSR